MGLFEALLEVIAPTRCAGCDAPGELLCVRCRAALPVVDPAYACPNCAAPFGYITCTECWEREFAFAGAVAVGSLERPLSRAITLYKDAGERRLAEEFGRMAATLLAPYADGAACVVPVPASRAAVVRRGFDHMALIAQTAAAVLD
ncbi:ComF family protein, partial [bacterium]|nr:ComF family protein [bacterium]